MSASKQTVQSKMQLLVSSAKNKTKGFSAASKSFASSFFDIRGDFKSLKKRAEVFKNYDVVLKFFISMVIVASLGFALVSVASKNGSQELFASSFIPSLFICAVIVGFSIMLDPVRISTLFFAISTSLLIMFGNSLQCMTEIAGLKAGTDVSTITKSTGDIIMDMAYFVVGAIVGYMIYRLIRLKKTKMVFALCFLANIVIFVLLAFSKPINNARNWIAIPGTDKGIQGTEFIKLFFAVGIAVILADKTIKTVERFAYSLIMLGLCGAGLALICGELGTLMIILIIYCLTLPLAFNSLKKTLMVYTALILVFVLVFSISYLAYNHIQIQKTETTQTQTVNPLTEKLSQIYKKFYDRVEDKNNSHSISIKKALSVVHWFGTYEDEVVKVHRQQDDTVFAYALMEYGLVPCFMLILLYVAMFYICIVRAYRIRKLRKAESFLLIMFAGFIVIQTLICIAVSLSIFPIVGLTSAFLSRGGSSTLTVYAMVMFILLALRVDVSEAENPESTVDFERNSAGRFAAIGVVGVFLTFFFILTSVYVTGAIPGLNKQADTTREEVLRVKRHYSRTEGIFYDRNGVSITEIPKDEKKAVIKDPTSFSIIIGYDSKRYNQSNLRKQYFDELFDLKYSNSRSDGKGADITLTVDSGMQKLSSDILKGYIGSISVINADTGEILALASRGHKTVDYNANLIDEEFPNKPSEHKDESYTYFDYYKNLINAFFYNHALLESDPPGSTIKVVTSIGIYEFKLKAKDKVVPELKVSETKKPIKNADKKKNNKVVNVAEALIYSINTYFAKKGLEMGAAAFEELLTRFMPEEKIDLDFGSSLNSYSFDVSSGDSDYELASTAYGQGKTKICGLHLSMIMGSILNRDMVKPYMVAKVENNGKIIEKGQTEIITKNVSSKSVLEKVKKDLHKVAKSYGFADESKSYGYVTAKSGTAETGEKANHNQSNHAYLIVGYEYKGVNYAICIEHSNLREKSQYGKELVPDAKQIIEYINNHY